MHPRLAIVMAVAALTLAGCIGGEVVTDATPSPVVPSTEPSSAAPSSGPKSIAPSSPAPTTSPAASPSQPTASPPEAPVGEGSPSDCSGTDDNRSFFEQAAANLDWPVYCAALPDRWFVTQGTYRTAGIGWLQITYRGPSGAELSLQEGAFCDDGDGCVPPGTGGGDSPFGDQSGEMSFLDTGGYAIAVDRGQHPSWLVIGTGMDESTFRELAASLIRLD